MAVDRTRVVRWLRVLLPLVALAILSTLFLIGKRPDAEPDIPYARVDAERMARDPRITAPRYAGVTRDGARISLTAAAATPDGRAVEALQLDWRAQDGLSARLTAPSAEQVQGRITLGGGVEMVTSSGWTLHAPEIAAATDQSRIAAPAGVEATAPFGRIEAGAMDLAQDAAGGDHVLNFTGGVRLLYQP